MNKINWAKIEDNLFKDTSPVKNWLQILFTIMVISFLKLIILGIEQKKVSTFFEIIVSLFIMLYLAIEFKRYDFEGWGGMVSVIIGIAGLVWIVFDKQQVFLIVMQLLPFIISGFIIWQIFYIFRKEKLIRTKSNKKSQ